MAMTRQLWSLNALANELGRDRRTVARALDKIPADGMIAKHKAWYLGTALAALQAYNCPRGPAVSGALSAAEHFLSRLESWRELYASEGLTMSLEETAECLDRPASVLLTWLRAGMPYVQAGDWETGGDFQLRPAWVFDFYLNLTMAVGNNGPAAHQLGLRP
jgi:hypothetical protein